MNRLESLGLDLEAAAARADGAVRAHDLLKAELAKATERLAEGRDRRRAADHALAEASRALSRASADRDIAEGRRESAEMAVTRHADEATEARGRLKEAEAQKAGLGDIAALRQSAEDIRMTVEAARVTMMTRRASLDELRRAGEARTRRLKDIEAEVAKWTARAASAGGRIEEMGKRREETLAELETARSAPARLAAGREKLALALSEAEARGAKAADALSAGESAEREARAIERRAVETATSAREARAAAEARADAAREGVEAAAARIAEDHETTPAKLIDSLDVDPDATPGAEELEARVQRLRRNREALGAVNLRAEEDAREVETEHAALVAEKADLEAAISKLRSGIASLNKEGRERLLTAFEQVNTNFSMLFRHLFGGGEAKLMLVESDDPLEAGLEIMCQPPGKKLATLSLLSGGEQTLTALALIFAVFLANPAPICVLDEVDAPLDDANVTRFCDMLDEMCRRTDTRFLIITHHAVTMARMDRLFGVTMGEQGVSQLVSVDLKAAESLVA
jgi:chromosome segregation protein